MLSLRDGVWGGDPQTNRQSSAVAPSQHQVNVCTLTRLLHPQQAPGDEVPNTRVCSQAAFVTRLLCRNCQPGTLWALPCVPRSSLDVAPVPATPPPLPPNTHTPPKPPPEEVSGRLTGTALSSVPSPGLGLKHEAQGATASPHVWPAVCTGALQRALPSHWALGVHAAHGPSLLPEGRA